MPDEQHDLNVIVFRLATLEEEVRTNRKEIIHKLDTLLKHATDTSVRFGQSDLIHENLKDGHTRLEKRVAQNTDDITSTKTALARFTPAAIAGGSVGATVVGLVEAVRYFVGA